MDDYTRETKAWLEERYQRGVEDGAFRGHRPIYGFGGQPSEPNHTNRMAIALSILRSLNHLDATTLVDLGGGEGYVATLARDLLGYEAMVAELPEAAGDRARQLFGLPAQAVDVHDLPWDDDSVDVIVLSEVIEHLRDPFHALAEAWRVARKALIITTQEAYPWRWERWARHHLRTLEHAHAERNHFHPDDFRALFGRTVRLRNPSLIVPVEDETAIDEARARKLVPWLAADLPFMPGSFGIKVEVEKTACRRATPRVEDSALIDGLFAMKLPIPNPDRSDEVPEINWPAPKPEDGDSKAPRPPMAPLAYTMSDEGVAHIDRVRKSFSGELPAFPGLPRSLNKRLRPLVRPLAMLLSLKAAAFRFALAPGSWGMKLRWAFKTLNGKRLKKLLGD